MQIFSYLVSMNQLLTYCLTEKITAMEMNQEIKKRFERIERSSILELQNAAMDVLDSQRDLEKEESPDWDRMPVRYDTPDDARPGFSLNEEPPVYKPDSGT